MEWSNGEIFPGNLFKLSPSRSRAGTPKKIQAGCTQLWTKLSTEHIFNVLTASYGFSKLALLGPRHPLPPRIFFQLLVYFAHILVRARAGFLHHRMTSSISIQVIFSSSVN